MIIESNPISYHITRPVSANQKVAVLGLGDDSIIHKSTITKYYFGNISMRE